MKLSIIIPCYNEKQTLSHLISLVSKTPIKDKEIILVDDGSTDGSTEIIKHQLENEVHKVVYHSHNLGKGAAIQSGLRYASGDIVIIQDADLEYNPLEYPKIINPILEGNADVVFGSRFLGDGPHRVHFFWHYIGNRLLTFVSNMITNLNLTDMETCYKAFKIEIIKEMDLKEKRFGIEPELTIKVAKRKCRIFEVGISYFGRSYKEGKKITWIDGLRAIYVLLKYAFFK